MPEKELFPLNRLIFLLDSVGQIAREDHSEELNMTNQNMSKTNNLSLSTCKNPIPIPIPPTSPTFSWIFSEKVPKQPFVWIFILASSSPRLSVPFPQPLTLDRQQESGTSFSAEKVAFFQSSHSWVPQQSSYNNTLTLSSTDDHYQ